MSRYSNSSLLAADERVTDEQLAEEAKILSFSRSVTRMSRRTAITSLATAAAAAGTIGMAGCSNDTPIPTTNPGPTVLDILTFALNLEYLEASFYNYVVNGTGLSATDMGSGAGTVSGGAKISFTIPAVAQIAANLAAEETAHVEFLRATIQSALGVTPASMPSLNLAAMGAPTTDAAFIALARQLETVGVSAYAGGAQYLTSSIPALTYAAQILHVEAAHAGNLRQLCIQYGVSSAAVDSMDIPPQNTVTGVFPTSQASGLVAIRTTSQVLQIVYAAPGMTGVSKGGFFPSGLTGNIYTS